MPKTGRPRSASPKAVTAFRLPPDLLARIDAYAERLRKEAPWADATRAHAVRALLVQALDAAGVPLPSALPKRKGQGKGE
jgi:hypothetical protein